MSKESVLIVDDEQDVAESVAMILRQAGLDAAYVTSGAAALRELEEHHYDLLITDLVMPKIDGMELLREVKRRWSDLPAVMLTAHGSVQRAVEAMKAGSVDFLSKPPDADQILAVIRRALHITHKTREAPPRPTARGEMIGVSPAIEEVRRLIEKAAETNATVLIRGESGTGKELVVRAVHALGNRRGRPLIPVHCATVPREMIDDHLFGHVKGSYTGAVDDKPGQIELADGGILFLDEMGEIPPEVQVKLLRVLEDRKVLRLGGTKPREVDVRFVAATHCDLEAMCRERTFREDLYFRLNVLSISVPPLRERGDDIEQLAAHFCSRACEANNKPEITIETEAMARLRSYSWPGNVRELENLIERLVIWADGPTITTAAVSREIRHEPPPPQELEAELPVPEVPAGEIPTLEAWMNEMERRYLVYVLKRCDTRVQAARTLGISRRTLHDKLNKHHLVRVEARA